MKKAGVNSSNVRELNRALVLRLICTSPEASRIWLSNQTGLTRMTLSNIISGLSQDGYIVDASDIDTVGGVGRRPVRVELAESSPLVMGITISRDYLSGLIMDLQACVAGKIKFPLSARDSAKSLTTKIKTAWAELSGMTRRRILGVGISSIGPVDIDAGRVLAPTNFHGISDLPVCDVIRDISGLPAVLRNDMSAAALAEKYYGMGRGISDFVYIGVTNGIGAGIVSGGELFLSKTGFSGEFGHTSIDYEGQKCSCGNRGCIELYVSVPKIIAAVGDDCGQQFADLKQVNAFCMHDEAAKYTLYSIMDKLAVALTSLVNLLDPSLVLIGGEGCALDLSVYRRLEKRVNRRLLARGSKQIEVRKAAFGEDAPYIGSAAIIADMAFTGKLPL